MAKATAVVESNIRCGDSLSGRGLIMPQRQGQFDYSRKGYQEPFPAAAEQRVPDTLFAVAIDWRRDFPVAAGAGGFDIVVGNPPYLRERNAKSLFDSLAATELGRRWREARMDLWYYFVHRGLDLLRPGGILSFIVNSYWISSRGAGKLIGRLQRETRLEFIELLNDAPVFKAIAGRHMIFRLRKRGVPASDRPQAERNDSETCRVVVTPLPSNRRRIRTEVLGPDALPHEFGIPLDELFQNGRLVIARPDPGQAVFRGRPALGEHFNTRQGMAENPPSINRRLQRQFPDQFAVGEGVFVLRTDEIDRLSLSPAERGLLRSYYETTAVGRYRLAAEPTHQVLYLTRHTAPQLDDFPNIAAHLGRFRPILECRRETREGKCAWWHLHWPREELIFLKSRILSVQMGDRPQFVFAERPTFVGFSINLILPGGAGSFALGVLTGILNSDVAQRWFERHAKRRGINLEINAHVLRQFPLPGRDEQIEQRMAVLVRERQETIDDEARAVGCERKIEDLVARLYECASGVGTGEEGVCEATPLAHPLLSGQFQN
jgi:adenine-specific DNA-methyltransferase